MPAIVHEIAAREHFTRQLEELHAAGLFKEERFIHSAQGAEMLVVSCPLCQYNLDRAQREAPAGRARAARVPVLYFSQLLAIALGCDETCMHLDDHGVDPRPRLSKWLEPRRQMATLAQ